MKGHDRPPRGSRARLPHRVGRPERAESAIHRARRAGSLGRKAGRRWTGRDALGSYAGHAFTGLRSRTGERLGYLPDQRPPVGAEHHVSSARVRRAPQELQQTVRLADRPGVLARRQAADVARDIGLDVFDRPGDLSHHHAFAVRNGEKQEELVGRQPRSAGLHERQDPQKGADRSDRTVVDGLFPGRAPLPPGLWMPGIRKAGHRPVPKWQAPASASVGVTIAIKDILRLAWNDRLRSMRSLDRGRFGVRRIGWRPGSGGGAVIGRRAGRSGQSRQGPVASPCPEDHSGAPVGRLPGQVSSGDGQRGRVRGLRSVTRKSEAANSALAR